ncbi:ammonia monooxygenase [Variovorax boronicumulans]|uniref:Ammonia monooxygenase n=1 Tax=Variovorax boronicumulans TaxID=436515 RepID=A0A250DI53_9BURK|nr:DUF6527 family protein [Variovorax boronicumulans]ATA53932.1 ammonia monooxygenase [Variovorax boronicumulans]
MSAVSRILRDAEGGRLTFWCPGCDGAHQVAVGPKLHENDARWGYNGNPEAPTFTPSILVRSETWTPPVTAENLEEWRRAPWPQAKVPTVCHSYVTDGRIQFLGDCTHALAGQTVDLPGWADA